MRNKSNERKHNANYTIVDLIDYSYTIFQNKKFNNDIYKNTTVLLLKMY